MNSLLSIADECTLQWLIKQELRNYTSFHKPIKKHTKNHIKELGEIYAKLDYITPHTNPKNKRSR